MCCKDEKNFIYPKSHENNQNRIKCNESTNGYTIHDPKS